MALGSSEQKGSFRIERMAENNLDLDVFMSEYWDEGYVVMQAEKVSLKIKAGNRKKSRNRET